MSHFRSPRTTPFLFYFPLSLLFPSPDRAGSSAGLSYSYGKYYIIHTHRHTTPTFCPCPSSSLSASVFSWSFGAVCLVGSPVDKDPLSSSSSSLSMLTTQYKVSGSHEKPSPSSLSLPFINQKGLAYTHREKAQAMPLSS